MWESVYQSALSRGADPSSAAQQAWGAVKRAGWYQDEYGVWRKGTSEDELRRIDEALE
jgi:hypothetical protein